VNARHGVSSLADSDGEESSGDGAEALSRSVRGAAQRASVRSAAAGTVRRRLVADLGTDDDPEVPTWKEDLEERWLKASEPRPIAAFSKESHGPEAVRKLSSESFLAGFPIFDAVGKANIPWLLGAHKQLLTALNGGFGTAQARSAAARQVGWLVRKAQTLGLVDDGEVRNGRLGRGKAKTAATKSQYCPELPQLLVAEQEVRFPVKPSARSRPGTSSRSGNKDELFSEDEAEDEVERLIRRRQAVSALKVRAGGRQAQIGARSSHDVNMRDVKSALLAPSLSFDLSAKADEEEEEGSGEELEVAVPVQEKPRKDSRRALLKEQLQKKLKMAMAKGLVAEPATAGNAEITAPSVSSLKAPSAEELELEIEDEAPVQTQQVPDEGTVTETVVERSRRKRRIAEDDEAVQSSSPAAAATDVASTAGPEPDTPVSSALETSKAESESPKQTSATEEKKQKLTPQKQARLDEIFFGRQKRQLEEKVQEAEPAAVTQEVELQSMDQGCSAEVKELHAEQVASRPRPLKRLRPANETMECPEDEAEDGEADSFADDADEQGEEYADDRLDEEWQEPEEADEALSLGMPDLEQLHRRRQSFLDRERLEAVRRKRQLDWEVDDADELQNEDRVIHLGTSTMSSKDRERWQSGIIEEKSSSVGAAAQAGTAGQGATKGPASDAKQLIWARGNDDACQLYGVSGRTTGRRASFLGKALRPESPGSE